VEEAPRNFPVEEIDLPHMIQQELLLPSRQILQSKIGKGNKYLSFLLGPYQLHGSRK
jgi:hypothetical protein